MGKRHAAALSGRRWRATRRRVFERDGWRCVQCGRAAPLECDHIVPLEKGGAPWDLDNLQTLCGGRDGCHVAKTRADRRARPETDEDRAWKAIMDEIRRL